MYELVRNTPTEPMRAPLTATAAALLMLVVLDTVVHAQQVFTARSDTAACVTVCCLQAL